jgi:hypothetical protein
MIHCLRNYWFLYLSLPYMLIIVRFSLSARSIGIIRLTEISKLTTITSATEEDLTALHASNARPTANMPPLPTFWKKPAGALRTDAE